MKKGKREKGRKEGRARGRCGTCTQRHIDAVTEPMIRKGVAPAASFLFRWSALAVEASWMFAKD